MELSGWVDSASRVAAGAAIASLWQGLLLAAGLWICLKMAPRLSASVRFAVWCAAFMAILLLPVLSFAHTLGETEASRRVAVASHPPVLYLDSRWAQAIAACWLALAIARGVGLAGSGLRAYALWKNAAPVKASEPLAAALRRACGPRMAGIFTSTEVDQPCVIGFLRPRILVPEWLSAKATAAEMRQIALHEASHLRRWDDWTNLAQKLALMVFPLNPALAWVERRLCSEREEACDERVVRETGSPREYAVCLTNLAAERLERRLRRRSAALSLGAWEHRSTLAGRIHRILRGGRLLSPAKARAVMAALLAATAAGAVKLGDASQTVAFISGDRASSSFAEQSRPARMSANAFRDVVFREPATAVRAAAPPRAMAVDAATPLRLAAKARLKSGRATVRSTVRRASLSGDQSRSWIVLTRWESSPNRQSRVMVIQSVFRFSPASAGSAAADGASAVPAQTGWFVFQL